MTITKQPSETHLITFDFSKKMSELESITTIDSTVSDPNDATYGTTTTNSQTVDVLISGGTAPTREDLPYTSYKLTMIVSTSVGQVLEQDIFMNIQDK